MLQVDPLSAVKFILVLSSLVATLHQSPMFVFPDPSVPAEAERTQSVLVQSEANVRKYKQVNTFIRGKIDR